MNQLVMFDDSDLPEEDRIFIRCATGRIKDRMKRTVEDIIEIGRDLIAVKARLPHGRFGPYLKSEFELSYPLAAKFMQSAERFGGKSINFIDFSPSVLYALAAPIVPDEVVDAAIEITQSGEPVTHQDVERLKQEIAELQRDKEATIQRLLNEKSELRREKEETSQRLMGERDREKAKRKQAEAVTKASDREQELAKQKATAEERAERLASELASAKAQLEGGLGVAELLEPKVVIKEDVEARREIERLRQQLAEKTRLHKLAAKHAEQFQAEMHKASSKATALETKLSERDDVEIVLKMFTQKVYDLKVELGFIATQVQTRGATLDAVTEQHCRDVADRLTQLIEMVNNQRSVDGCTQLIPAQAA